MKRILMSMVALLVLGTAAFAAGQSEAAKPLIWVWYPNESGEELRGARDEIAKVVTEATGRPVEHKLTTDYIIAIEAVANKNAHIGFFGAEGYIQGHDRNPAVKVLVVNSGASGTLKDAVYYSWLAVKEGNEGMYKSGSGYSIETIQGKRFSFVSNSSTSGFRVPTAGIVKYFSAKSDWAKLTTADLIEGGQGKFFKEVLFGGSHQGSAVNLLTGKVDVAAFCDTCVANYVDFVSGTDNRPGAVYKVKDKAAEPFNTLGGQRFVVISSTPVLNAPFVYNSDILDAATAAKILTALTSDATAKNPKIFVPKGAAFKGLFAEGQRFLPVEDSWFNPIRELAGK
jgi:phosphonate transport system substrate-binding protein